MPHSYFKLACQCCSSDRPWQRRETMALKVIFFFVTLILFGWLKHYCLIYTWASCGLLIIKPILKENHNSQLLECTRIAKELVKRSWDLYKDLEKKKKSLQRLSQRSTGELSRKIKHYSYTQTITVTTSQPPHNWRTQTSPDWYVQPTQLLIKAIQSQIKVGHFEPRGNSVSLILELFFWNYFFLVGIKVIAHWY